MNNKTLPVCLSNRYSYHILADLKVEIIVEENHYNIPLDALFLMAARKNTKRGFLFVSKILGKHIPVHPLIPLIGGVALGTRYVSMMYNETVFEERCDLSEAFMNQAVMKRMAEYNHANQLSLPEPTLFIGFAETATALGHAVFSSFATNARYIHTTRENIVGIDNILHFKEEHSHATEHDCYAIDPSLFENEDMIVLVDDEITTGKSALNFIRAIQSKYPRRQYAVLSILDWRSCAEKKRFADMETELGIRIDSISLLSGSIAVTGKPVVDVLEPKPIIASNAIKSIVETVVLDNELGRVLEFSSLDANGELNKTPYLYSTGRFGINSMEQAELEHVFQQVGSALGKKRQGQKTLCLGTGEFMYIPFKIASYMGDNIVVQSTTRSPIYPAKHDGYAVQQAISFASPNDISIVNYVYNIPEAYYDEVFVFLECEVDSKALESLLRALETLAIPRIVCIVCVGKGREYDNE